MVLKQNYFLFCLQKNKIKTIRYILYLLETLKNDRTVFSPDPQVFFKYFNLASNFCYQMFPQVIMGLSTAFIVKKESF